MNKFIVILTGVLLSFGAVYPDELDNLIVYGLANSAAGKTISNTLGIGHLSYSEAYLSLLPELSANVSYDSGASSGVQSGQWSGSIAFSESFPHVDSIIQGLVKAGNQLDINKIQAEVDKRSYIDSVIQQFVQLGVNVKQIELLNANIDAQKSSLKVIETKLKNGQEIALNAKKLSNDIMLAAEDLALKSAESVKASAQFAQLVGKSIAAPSWNPDTLDIPQTPGTNSQYQLSLKMKELLLANNSVDIGLAIREHFLPKLSLSFDYGYDMWDNQTSWGVSAGVSFNLFDFFERENKIAQLNYQKANIELAVGNIRAEYEYTLMIMLKKLDVLEKKAAVQKGNVELERELQKLYTYQYQTDQIDYPEYQLRMNSLLQSELTLLQTQADLYLLKKRIQYGIVKI
ncbi:MAG: TolC family protein [Brevinematales bacterium]|nr:TolC family protein [Brevinematales bacterium]